MNKLEFLSELEDKIQNLPYHEVKKIKSYYLEIIDDKLEDGIKEVEVIKSLGSIESIVKEINSIDSVTDTITNKIKNHYKSSGNKTLWTVLVIISFPIWSSLIISILAIIFSIYAVIFSIFLCLFICLFSILIVSITTFLSFFYFLFSNTASALAMLGVAFITFGIFLLLVRPLLGLFKFFINQNKKLTRFIVSKIKKGNKAHG